MTCPLTIAQYLRDAGTDARLTSVLHGVARACSEVTTDLQVGELNALQGDLGCDNVHGEIQKQMDLIAHDIFVRRLVETGEVAALVSEEAEEIIEVPAADARYLVAFDPMDGSSNVSLNMSVGSIFSVRRAEGPASDAFLRPGTEQVAAGYTIYGPSTLLVLATGNLLAAFARDPRDGEFRLVQERFSIPPEAREFAINMSRYHLWDGPVREYIDECIADRPGRYNMRWIASMVAEIHRILTRGGIFLYPLDRQTGDRGGRLRWLYEACPMAYVVEAAGGAGSTGQTRILELSAVDVHQRIPVILGAANDVNRLLQRYTAHRQY